MLGTDMIDRLRHAGVEATGLGRQEVDVTDAAAVEAAVASFDIVVNCAAWTAVDDAEAREADAFRVNALGAAIVARACTAVGARMVHVSTDYVFDGAARSPYAEGGEASPRSAYGRTKLAGEWAVRAEAPDHLIVRTAWLYGEHGPCFPKTMARLGAEKPRLAVVDDQVGQPTWTVDLADLIIRLVQAGAPSGTYHGTASGETSWFGFTQRVLASAHLSTPLEPTTSDQFVCPAPRPAYSVLGHAALERVGVAPIADWADRWDEAAPCVLSRG